VQNITIENKQVRIKCYYIKYIRASKFPYKPFIFHSSEMNHVPSSARLPTDPSILMNWVNALIESDFHSLKDLRSFIVWCRLLEALYPGSIDLTALKTDKLGWLRNYRVLRRTLRNLGLKLPIKVSELVSGKVGDTIYLLHFFINLFTMILARKIRQVKARDAKASSTIVVVLQWFKSFFVKKREVCL